MPSIVGREEIVSPHQSKRVSSVYRMVHFVIITIRVWAQPVFALFITATQWNRNVSSVCTRDKTDTCSSGMKKKMLKVFMQV